MEFSNLHCLLFPSTGLSTVFSGGKINIVQWYPKYRRYSHLFVLLCVFTLGGGKGTQCIGCASREYFSNLNKWYKINTVIASPPVRQHASAWYSTVNSFYRFDIESNPFASQMFLGRFLFRLKEIWLLLKWFQEKNLQLRKPVVHAAIFNQQRAPAQSPLW